MSKIKKILQILKRGEKNMIKVACYIRVSHQEQRLHGISLDAQKDKLLEYVEKHNLKLVEWYADEGVSGRKLIKRRPELQRMLHDAHAGKFDRILFIKLDRFFRSVAEYHEFMKKISPRWCPSPPPIPPVPV
jgi:DNA invertase Pin-like site-specific DNA recombinase